ncbi:MAG: hypothetical protein E6590_11250 [Clostridiales bacterium]|uniref:hypothetical protein n=1 Tax=Zhenhengia sp. TaxID=2944208 RepID=UPI00290B42E1|nr:hypothetical protein [Clostridiales bacterium]
MIYRFYCAYPDVTQEYMESILKLVGNVKEFEVFRFQEDTPYVVDEDGEKKRYTFILKDDRENEFWLYTACGYSGEGPRTTRAILHLLGLKDDFKISKEGNNHIVESDLRPVHKINLLIAQDKAEQYRSPKRAYISLLSLEFKYAYQRKNFMDALKLMGYIQNVRKDDALNEKSYLFSWFDVSEEDYYYPTNNMVTLRSVFRDFSKENIEVMIKELIEKTGGEITEEKEV